ncbi:uncharacterized protein J8A68_000396 [[Candida] subhashii]|uniref:Uncharacterized protein n=1 Tax=[Candida] subhashii TaxID=561895 RepID=A0A8J5UMJ3_9ASCO|nr:uncharacterized protein J8A68_000396 [[Candida] subhashii]KAG7666138.1 hypothetical protein J8A68_000396 [[Candida] subhashii]
MSTVTNPSLYSIRDVLLLSQLLHINGIKGPQELDSASNDSINTILTEWKQHKTVQLENKVIKVNTKAQLKELYHKLLKKYQVESTEELANFVYFARIEELESDISQYKEEFREVLNRS